MRNFVLALLSVAVFVAGAMIFERWRHFCSDAKLRADRVSTLELICFTRAFARPEGGFTLLTRPR